MPKIKAPSHSPSLDMTPMVDLAFLLVTFFMLTATMRAPEPVIVDTPSSISDVILPKNTMLITIDTSGRVFFNMEGKEVRQQMLRRMMNQFPEVKFTEDEIVKFGSLQSFGVPFSQLPEFINAEQSKRDIMNRDTKGIPMDTLNHKDELSYWINFGRVEEYTWPGPDQPGQKSRSAPLRNQSRWKSCFQKSRRCNCAFQKAGSIHF